MRRSAADRLRDRSDRTDADPAARGIRAGAEDSYPAPDPDYMDAVISKLGPVPAGDTYTPEQAQAALLADADVAWDSVARSFPDEPRPEYTLVRQVEDSEYVEAQVACLEARGISVTVTAGNRGFSADGGTAVVRVASYLCEVEYPPRSQPPLTPQQLAYVYDYFVQFKAPCLEQLGYELAPPVNAPTKEEFVANWPRQNWNPGASNILDAEMAAVELACPNYPTGLR